MKKERLFTNRQLLTLLWPLIIEQMLEILVGMADTVMVSSVGEAAISGVSLVDMINQLIITLFGALATGGAVVTSQHLGAKRPGDAAKSAGQLVGLSAILGVGVAAFCLITRTAQLRLFFGTITDEVMQACLTYFTITALSFPFLALYNAGAAIFRSTGNSAVSMKVSVIVNGINFCGNALCVFVLKMGVAGVAVPTLISRAVGACIILALAARQDYQLRITPQSVTRFEGRTVKSILYIGIPSAFENSLFQLGRLLVVRVIAVFGTVQIAANAVANTTSTFLNIPASAVGLAVLTVVGQCLGAGEKEQAVWYARRLLLLAYAGAWIMNLSAFFFADQLALTLFHLSPEAQTMALQVMQWFNLFSIFFWPSSFTLPNILRAAGDASFTMSVSIVSMWVFRVGFCYLMVLCFHGQLLSIWMGMFLDWVFRSVCFMVRFVRGKWLEQHVI